MIILPGLNFLTKLANEITSGDLTIYVEIPQLTLFIDINTNCKQKEPILQYQVFTISLIFKTQPGSSKR